jgi:hypothetical protein
MPSYLTKQQVDAVVEALRRQPGDHVSRGRGGAGFGFRDGVFYAIWVEECDREDYRFPDEAAFRKVIAEIDLDDDVDRYRVSVLQRLLGEGAVRRLL